MEAGGQSGNWGRTPSKRHRPAASQTCDDTYTMHRVAGLEALTV